MLWRHEAADLVSDLARRPGRAKLALGLVALALATAALHPFAVSLVRLTSAVHHFREGPAEERQRQLGRPYTEGVETLRQTLHRDEPYALTQAPTENGTPIEGAALWIRFDLAPRKAVDLGGLESLTSGGGRPKWRHRLARLPPEIRWVVVAHEVDGRPEILSREDFIASLAGRADAP